MPARFPAAIIENLEPLIEGGRYAIKRVVGEDVVVEADIFKDGHDIVAAALKWRVVGQREWHESAMRFVDNDRWRGIFSVYENATYEYSVEAWTDVFAGWQHEYATKFNAGLANLTSEKLEGAALLMAAAKRARGTDARRLRELAEKMRTADHSEVNRIAHLGELEVLMATYAARSGATQYAPAPRVIVDRVAARS
ncbi:MAG TPA: maltotransferase domain-containing protein, partial [Chthoniobacterales bacterium]